MAKLAGRVVAVLRIWQSKCPRKNALLAAAAAAAPLRDPLWNQLAALPVLTFQAMEGRTGELAATVAEGVVESVQQHAPASSPTRWCSRCARTARRTSGSGSPRRSSRTAPPPAARRVPRRHRPAGDAGDGERRRRPRAGRARRRRRRHRRAGAEPPRARVGAGRARHVDDRDVVEHAARAADAGRRHPGARAAAPPPPPLLPAARAS